MVRILMVDNFDSFVYNVVQYLAQLGAVVDVVRADRVDLGVLSSYDGVVVSPGPGAPEGAGMSVPVVRRSALEGIPLLGICLGHQALAVTFGGVVGRCPELLHGKVSEVVHDGSGVFEGLPQGFRVTRYHSLAALESSLPPEIVVSARTLSGVVMGLRHVSLPLEGVQFHPESVLTEHGHRVLARFLARCGLPAALEAAEVLAEGQLRLLERLT